MELRQYLNRQLKYVWSIGIYDGPTPTALACPPGVINPVLTAADVSDRRADSVADPFMVHHRQRWHMFFEVFAFGGKGEIGWAESDDGIDWAYRHIVLSEPFHLSYPYVFEWEGDYYMMPECSQTRTIRLYKAVEFPARWICIGTILENFRCTDSSIFRFRDTWWLFTATDRSSTLRLYYADDLLGEWTEHPCSPVVHGDRHRARPAGRVTAFQDRIIRFSQDCYPHYGLQVLAHEIVTLTRETYQERRLGESPVLGPSGRGWNAYGMHHLDVQPLLRGGWRACVDGWTSPTVMSRAMLTSIRVMRGIATGWRKPRLVTDTTM